MILWKVTNNQISEVLNTKLSTKFAKPSDEVGLIDFIGRYFVLVIRDHLRKFSNRYSDLGLYYELDGSTYTMDDTISILSTCTLYHVSRDGLFITLVPAMMYDKKEVNVTKLYQLVEYGRPGIVPKPAFGPFINYLNKNRAVYLALIISRYIKGRSI